MKIVVDAMGGDLAPAVNVQGAIDALRAFPDVEIERSYVSSFGMCVSSSSSY